MNQEPKTVSGEAVDESTSAEKPAKNGEAADKAAEAPTATTDGSALQEQLAAAQQQLAAAKEEVAAARKESQQNLEGWQRQLAEFQNYKKRVDREVKDSYQNASVDLLTKLLPIIDDFERALANVPSDLDGNVWVNGMNLIQRKFNKVLEDYGVTAIDPKGQPFDPNLHQAIGADENTEYESGYVTATMQKGYISGERVLRPALVKIAK